MNDGPFMRSNESGLLFFNKKEDFLQVRGGVSFFLKGPRLLNEHILRLGEEEKERGERETLTMQRGYYDYDGSYKCILRTRGTYELENHDGCGVETGIFWKESSC